MEHDRSKVRWADGTYDRSRCCDGCRSHTCQAPIHQDFYKEIGSVASEEAEQQGYWNWMFVNKPCGGEWNEFGEFLANELFNANPDGVAMRESQGQASGISAQQHEWVREGYDTFTERQKEVWDLVMREQGSQADAAERLGISNTTVGKHLRYAKTKLINFLRSKQDDAGSQGMPELREEVPPIL